MGGSTAIICSSYLTSSFPVPWTAFQQAAQKGWRVVLNPVSIDPAFLWPFLFVWSIADAWWISSGIVASSQNSLD